MSTSRFATIHGGLLARKGQASPAVPSVAPHVAYTDAIPPELPPSTDDLLRDIELPPGLTLMATKTASGRSAQELIEEVQATFPPEPEPEPEPEPPAEQVVDAPCSCDPEPGPESGATRKPKYRVTVRVTAEQRRRMRISAAQLEKPNQQILSEALDAYLDRLGTNEMKGCACLKHKAC